MVIPWPIRAPAQLQNTPDRGKAGFVLKRVAIQWGDEEPYEDSDVVAVTLGGFYTDVRIGKKDRVVKWCRAGERMVLHEEIMESGLRKTKYRWTRIIDSLEKYTPDEYEVEEIPGPGRKFIERGRAPNPDRNNKIMSFTEYWIDATSTHPGDFHWLFQCLEGHGHDTFHESGSSDGKGDAFLSKVGDTYVALRRLKGTERVVRRRGKVMGHPDQDRQSEKKQDNPETSAIVALSELPPDDDDLDSGSNDDNLGDGIGHCNIQAHDGDGPGYAVLVEKRFPHDWRVVFSSGERSMLPRVETAKSQLEGEEDNIGDEFMMGQRWFVLRAKSRVPLE